MATSFNSQTKPRSNAQGKLRKGVCKNHQYNNPNTGKIGDCPECISGKIQTVNVQRFSDFKCNVCGERLYPIKTLFPNKILVIILSCIFGVSLLIIGIAYYRDPSNGFRYDKAYILFDSDFGHDPKHRKKMFIVVRNWKYGAIGTGLFKKEIIPTIYDKISYIAPIDKPAYGHLLCEGFVCELNGKCALFSKEGEPLTNLEYDYIDTYKEENGLIRARFRGYMGYINDRGIVTIPFEYNYITHTIKEFRFQNDLLAVQRYNQKWGFIDQHNNIVIPFQYDDVIETFSNGTATVKKDGRIFVIDIHGNTLYTIEH